LIEDVVDDAFGSVLVCNGPYSLPALLFVGVTVATVIILTHCRL